jgi:N,N'-diacetyllegionaminate synthase
MQTFEIAQRAIGPQEPCFIIAEMGLAHDGSLGAAHAFIDAAAVAGADAVKFQTHIAEAEGTPEEKFRVNTFPQDSTRQDYWNRTAFEKSQWFELKQHADALKVVFLSSVFSIEALQLLEELQIPAWKLGSGEMTNLPLLDAMIDTGVPLLLSTGMSTWAEIDNSVRFIQDKDAPLLVFQCTNRYPCPPEHIGLNMISELKERYDCPIGFSDHSGEPSVGFAARIMGACMLECHVTFSKQCFGPDVPASLTFDDFGQMISSIRLFEHIIDNPVYKDKEAQQLSDIRELFTKSIVPVKNLEKGTVILEKDITYKKPGTGIPASEYRNVIGKKLKRSLMKDELFSWIDLINE